MLRAKTLLIYGSADPLTGNSHGTKWQKTLPNARLEMNPGGGHDLLVPMWKRVSHTSLRAERQTESAHNGTYGLLDPGWRVLLIGAITFFVLTTMKVGTPDTYGDYPLAWGFGLGVGLIIAAGGLFGMGRWLNSKQPAGTNLSDNPVNA